MRGMNDSILKAISLAGSPAKLAHLVSIQMGLAKPLTPMAVRQWISRGVPAEYCIHIEASLCRRVLRHELRPDLYPPDDYEFLVKGDMAASK